MLGVGVLLPAVFYFAVRVILAAGAEAMPVSRYTAPEPGVRTEVIAVFISSSFCGANSLAGFPEAVVEMKSRLRAKAAEEGKVFRSVGVSVDWDPYVGADYLRQFGDFDEIVSGGNWLNTATQQYIWGDFSFPAAVPQMIVLERQVETGETTIIVSPPEVVESFLGGEVFINRVAGARTASDSLALP